MMFKERSRVLKAALTCLYHTAAKRPRSSTPTVSDGRLVNMVCSCKMRWQQMICRKLMRAGKAVVLSPGFECSGPLVTETEARGFGGY